MEAHQLLRWYPPGAQRFNKIPSSVEDARTTWNSVPVRASAVAVPLKQKLGIFCGPECQLWAGSLPDIDLTRLRDPRTTCGPACDSSLAGASFVCLTCETGSGLGIEAHTSEIQNSWVNRPICPPLVIGLYCILSRIPSSPKCKHTLSGMSVSTCN